jgi:thymidylate synthase
MLSKDTQEQSYLDLLRRIISIDEVRFDRTNEGTLSLFGTQMTFSIQNCFPVITTKKIWLRGIIEELLFFISGKTDTKILEEKGINIWKGNTSAQFLKNRNLPYREGDMGPGYGHQWRHYGAEYKGCDHDYTGQGIDQLMNLIDGIKNDPFSRRHIINAWDTLNINLMALPPCHCFVQFYVSSCGKFLDCMLYQRSADMFLGVPFNITSYCLLNYIIAHFTEKTPRNFIHTIGDAHIYLTHISQVKEQLTREPYPFPSLEIIGDPQTVEDLTYKSFKIIDYKCHPAITGQMAV